MGKKQVHLISNAHLDPIWLWEWQEGAAEALSTFRTAADLCEAYDGFVFNHNEAVLYEWVAEYEPELFERIKRLVEAGRWHIMGGWFLQPDCNMPSGESFVRQALTGKRFFAEHFGAAPRTAINFDPFGHTRGLVQILAKSGSDSYLFMRPHAKDLKLPSDDFTWVGYDGSTVSARRFGTGYNSGLGRAGEKVASWLDRHDTPVQIVPWGVGNHGGGPSRKDIRDLNELAESRRDEVEIIHSTPEAYFDELRRTGELPEHRGDLNSWAPGCYTSQIRIKQFHRALENEYYRAEKMASHASTAHGASYPSSELDEALRDLLTAEFHDILPGSSIRPAEEATIRLLDHGREIVSRVAARSFFSLCSGQPAAEEGSYPILVYNPHPYPVTGVFACELNLADQNWSDSWTVFDVERGGAEVPSQVERELSNINLDWRKRVVFEATLAPSSINRFTARPRVLPGKPEPPSTPLASAGHRSPGATQSRARSSVTPAGRFLEFRNDEMELLIDGRTGAVARYSVGGEPIIVDGARPLVISDYEDPWGSSVSEFRHLEGAFSPLNPAESARFAGVDDRAIDPIRVVEDGPVRTVVEVSLGYRDSRILLTYFIPRRGATFDVELDVLWQEKNRMLKLALSTPFTGGRLYGQVAYGVEELPTSGKELVTQKWQCITDKDEASGLLCIDDGIYGCDCRHGELRLSLLRSPAYSALSGIRDREPVARHRHTPRIDQGSRRFSFRLTGGRAERLLAGADREALSFNEVPYVLSFYPAGAGGGGTDSDRVAPGVELTSDSVVMTAWKRSADDDGWVLRLYNPLDRTEECGVAVPASAVEQEVSMGPYEIKTLKIDDSGGPAFETDLLESPIG